VSVGARTGGADELEPFAEVEELLVPVRRVRHHVVVEQHLVSDRCGLGDEGRVARLFVRLGLVGEQQPGTSSTIKGDIVSTPGAKK